MGNWNRCLQRARGRWVMILHEDDTLYPWYLDTVAARLRDGIGAVCTLVVQGATPPVRPRPTVPAHGAPLPASLFHEERDEPVSRGCSSAASWPQAWAASLRSWVARRL